jgi:hypothetical protein
MKRFLVLAAVLLLAATSLFGQSATKVFTINVLPGSGGGGAPPPFNLPSGLGWQTFGAGSFQAANICPSDPTIQGTSGCRAILRAWGDSIYDTKRNQYCIWGGGHTDYFGNEMYCLPLPTKVWAKVTTSPVTPTTNPNLTGPEAQSDGNPTSRHTYRDLVYLPNQDAMFSQCGATAGNPPFPAHGTWWFQYATGVWVQKTGSLGNGGTAPACAFGYSFMAYDSNNDLVWVDDGNTLFSYSPSANAYTQPGSFGNMEGNDFDHKSAVVDPQAKVLWVLGGTDGFRVDISNPATPVVTRPTLTGCSSLTGAGYPALAYDPAQNLVIGWTGGNSVIELNTSTNTCTTVTPTGTAPDVSDNEGGSGLVYVPDANVFIAVGGWNAAPAILRLTTVVNTFQVISASASATLPFTVGLGFKQGDVPNSSSVTLNVPTKQVIAKATWPDGSVKMAIASGEVQLLNNFSKTISVVTTSGASGTSLTCANIQTAAPTASVQAGSIGTVSLSSLLASPFRTWVSGPEMVECHYRAPIGADPTLEVWYHVRLYKSGRMWVRAITQNGLLDVVTANKSYVPTVIIGGTTVYNNGGAALSHFAQTRWSAEGWIGGDPQVTPKHDTIYLEASKLLPNYMNQTPSAAALNGLAQTYTPMGHGDWTVDMGSTGFQNQIGLLPLWDALYATSQADSRAYNAVLSDTKSLNSYAIIWKSNITHLTPRPSDYPTWSFAGNHGGGATSIGAGTLNWDVAHHGSGGYLAYLITGDYYYLETMQDQAAMCYLIQNSANGNGTSRYIFHVVQDRGVAWCFRSMSQYEALAPQSDTIVSDYNALLANSTTAENTIAQASNMNPLGYILHYDVDTGSYSTTASVLAPWQQHFYIQAIGMGADIKPLADMTAWNALEQHLDLAAVGILGPNGASTYCFTNGFEYNLQVADTVTDPTQWYPDWGTLWTKNFGSANTSCGNTLGGTSGGDPANASTGYWGNLMPAISYAKDHGAPGAAASWTRLTGATNWNTVLSSGFGDVPIFGIIPR